MKHRRITKRRMTLAGAGAAALVAGTLSVSYAGAAEPTSPTPKQLSPTAATELASDLVAELTGDAAGAYYDADAKKLVVNVVDEADVDAVEAKGAEARLVEHTLAELRSAKAKVSDSAVPGTALAVDPKSNKLVVTVDRTVKGAELTKLNKAVKALGDKATLKKSAGEFKPFIAGGDAIYSSGSRCSLGFNVTVGGQPGFITAGHCGEAGSSWSDSSGGSPIGTMEESTFPGEDHALVLYNDSGVDAPSEVNLYNGSSQPITGATEATVGMEVQRSGSTTQVHDGTVTGVDASVTYPQGTVNGLIQTDVCAEPGDSGGALFAGDQAVGLTSGGSGDCTSGGETFFYPVTDALAEYNASIG